MGSSGSSFGGASSTFGFSSTGAFSGSSSSDTVYSSMANFSFKLLYLILLNIDLSIFGLKLSYLGCGGYGSPEWRFLI